MKWKGRQGSNNIIDDRRTSSGGGTPIRFPVRLSGGSLIGLLALLIIYMILGGNPLSLISNQGVTNYQASGSDDEKMEFLRVVLKDTEDIWAQVFEAYGEHYKEPVMHVFHGSVRSACGVASAQSGPFYCPGDKKIYIDLDFFDELSRRLGAPGDFAIAYVIAHEVGHHVQNSLGILGQKQSLRRELSDEEYNKISVAIELQADYLAGVWARHEEELGYLETGDIGEAIAATEAVGDDTLQKKFQGTVVPDSFTHGTSEMRKRWFLKGYNAGDLSEFDTFSVKYEDL